jgi:hypothetical protein
MQASGARVAGRSTYLPGALCAALLLLRSPGSLLHPQFWAEDGTLFFQQAFNEGFLRTVLRPFSGYLHLFPRLVAGISLLFPMEAAPLVFNLAAFAAQLLPALYLLNPRLSPVIPSLPARAAAALLCVAAPASFETHVNLTNSQWHLALSAVLLLFAAPSGSVLIRMLEAVLLVIFSLTGPFSFFLLPVVAPRLFKAARGAPWDQRLTGAAIVAAGAVVQAGFAVTSARISAGSSQFGHLGLQELMTVVSMHAFYDAVLGVNGLARIYRSLPPAAHWLGLLALAFLAFLAVRDRIGPLVALLYLAALSIASWAAFPLNDPRIWLSPGSGSRYFLFASLFVILALLRLAATASPLRWVGIVLLGVALAVGIPSDFIHPRQPDVQWGDNVAVFRSLPPGSDFYVPVVPLFHPGMLLHKSDSRREQPPLEEFRQVGSPTQASFTVARPRRVTLNQEVNDSFLGVAGWTIDGAALKPAGGVFVVIDDKLFPAVRGLPSNVGPGEERCTDCGFSRLIPVAEIGPGAHEASLVVITGDRKGRYQPTPPQPFAMDQFFP